MSIDVRQFGKIGVLMGGYSSEREISLKSGQAIFDALREQGCDVVALDIQKHDDGDIVAFIKKADIDLAFIALHGALGEDGRIQQILEKLQIPYTGSGVKASQTALNKIKTQNLMKKHGIQVPAHVTVSRGQNLEWKQLNNKLGAAPFVVKPNCEGSSVGVSIVRDKDSLHPALEQALEYGDQILIDKFIKGREMTVGILDHEALPIVEVLHKREFFDFTAKYQKGLTDYRVPADIPPHTASELQHIALKAHNLLGCRDFSRIDFILDDQGTAYLLEVNTIPGFTATSLLPKAAHCRGLNFHQLCLKIVELAYGKKKEYSPTPSVS